MLVLLMCHFVGDYYLQWKQLIEKKKQSFVYLLLHVFIYILPFVGVAVWFHYPIMKLLIPIFVSHLLIDIGKTSIDKKYNHRKYVFRHFCVDQLLHILVLSFYSSIFVVNSIWIWIAFIIIIVIQPIPLVIKLYKISYSS